MTAPTPSPHAGRDRVALRKHLSSYWKMEAANVLLIPAFCLFVLKTLGDAPDLATWLGMAACSLQLVIGTAAWRLAIAGIDGDAALADRLTAACAWAQWPALGLTIVASAALVPLVVAKGWPPHAIAAAVCTVLAWLEYVNYYHWQLQNFDSMIDFRRLLAGRGLRRAHLGRAVQQWRSRRHR
jgi:hypothetical protein